MPVVAVVKSVGVSHVAAAAVVAVIVVLVALVVVVASAVVVVAAAATARPSSSCMANGERCGIALALYLSLSRPTLLSFTLFN